MGKILCATRGGEASVRNQNAAIQRAKEGGDELYFFFVVDVEFLAHADYALRSDVVTSEMEKMAHFLMAMAVERAGKQSVKADYIIRHGHFGEELRATVKEQNVSLIILGMPGGEESAFKVSGLQSFAEEVHKDTGVEVWIPGIDEAQ
jgi:nucleotide-binding universal stress UspA family protein